MGSKIKVEDESLSPPPSSLSKKGKKEVRETSDPAKIPPRPQTLSQDPGGRYEREV